MIDAGDLLSGTYVDGVPSSWKYIVFLWLKDAIINAKRTGLCSVSQLIEGDGFGSKSARKARHSS